MSELIIIIKNTIRELFGIEFDPIIGAAPKWEIGEYCTNIFPLAKPLGQSPGEIAERVADALCVHTDFFRSVNATGGYVNFVLTDTIWQDFFHTIHHAPHPDRHETVVVDYIGMNVGKPPHIGHICTPLQGQAIINTLRFLGYRVIADSHLGDWGSLFGKLIVGFRKYGDETKLREDAINHLLEIYILINADAEADPSVEQACRDAFRELSLGNREYTAIWERFTKASIQTNKRILEMMHISQDYDIGESFYEGIDLPKIGDQPPLQYDMDMIVNELIEKNIATRNDDGSVGVIFDENTKMPSTILRKRDGTNLYLTSDLAAIKYRLTNGWNPSKIIYFVDNRQSLHLRQAFWIAEHAWPDLTKGVEFIHAANGAMVLPEGAMSTRKGNIIRLDALVEGGFDKVARILEEKGRTGDNALSESDIREITIAAIKYSYLSQDRERDIVFSWDKALNFEGNSGPYIQYAYVRAEKIIESIPLIPLADLTRVTFSEYDKKLIQKLLTFEDTIIETAIKCKPHILAIYAYELAVNFNTFYVHTPKILEESNPDIRNFRLALVKHVADALELAFDLIGIRMPTEM